MDESIRTPQATRVVGVTAHLRGPAGMAFDDNAVGHPIEDESRRKEERVAGHKLLGLAHIRYNFLGSS